MAEIQTYIFEYKEVVEALIQQQGIHEGFWGIYMEFGIAGANIQPQSEDVVVPAAIVPVMKIGIQRYDTPNELTVDAAEKNPVVTESPHSIRGRSRNLR
jgi:hypothetical protein